MVEILEDNEQLIIRIGGQEYARYSYRASLYKPYLYPLRAANGLSLVADAPTDHRHHHGFWVGHGRVEETDFWLERHNSGRIVHQQFEQVRSGEVGTFTEVCHWIGPDGRHLLSDHRTFAFHDTSSEARLFDFEIQLRAPGQEPVSLHPTNESGIPQIRVADGLTVRTGGTLTNAEGKQNERGTYKQNSPWLDCSGKLGRLTCGIALFDHPANPAHPTPWFTRDYGPFAPNYGFFQQEPIVITPDQPLVLRYRVYTHSGDVHEGKVQQAWEAYRASALQMIGAEPKTTAETRR
jgi:hypothetical protein